MLRQTFPPKDVSCMGRTTPHHDTKILRPSASFMGHMTRLKFPFLRLQISTLCMENKVFGITSSLQNIRSFNIMVEEI